MTEEIKHIAKSHAFRVIVYGIIALVALLFVFQAGVFVGFEKASFYNKIGENYFQQVSGNSGDITEIKKGDTESAHGAVGQIVQIKLPLIVVEDHDGVEKTIQIATTTQIKNATTTEDATSLKQNDFVVVFGTPSPTDPVLVARLIRILPPPVQ